MIEELSHVPSLGRICTLTECLLNRDAKWLLQNGMKLNGLKKDQLKTKNDRREEKDKSTQEVGR